MRIKVALMLGFQSDIIFVKLVWFKILQGVLFYFRKAKLRSSQIRSVTYHRRWTYSPVCAISADDWIFRDAKPISEAKASKPERRTALIIFWSWIYWHLSALINILYCREHFHIHCSSFYLFAEINIFGINTRIFFP